MKREIIHPHKQALEELAEWFDKHGTGFSYDSDCGNLIIEFYEPRYDFRNDIGVRLLWLTIDGDDIRKVLKEMG